ncbi:hypothetical protein A2673_03325 [Candidatus Kaiserbacteria bacterium RIFCSPHIGHO2_01_FULL_50_13]|uniref:Lactamase n=1 Tax=Candidatus Kaiserbacteria bacterium RIFCSPLOWO2_01_FULL_50_24 TaxID=1798507 RepID=A0A1F6EIR1_9BACT|nr:MAG: hypothetical protein A2673_03325 [Candidatus Kaiserbacteria bacterium RIFCSPHIGHO2_01_FULL_50_13]OGG73535.1 MAG: hypothetical protein A3A34_01165 [Candidatus Kaiserbacteria bacterium RIFCSPLOWO2_01_FULL_50_24]OGG81583.1 MAG: hypothetical protein A3H74_00700 [Candidatus Kaiserbacteria bacterium RIFCSPLOWO2_02_FULL_51_13]
MILTYHGGACIRAQAGDTTLVLGPVSKKSSDYKPTNFGADVACVPLNHPDMNGVEEAARGEKIPFLIFGPGEYEVRGMTIAGFGSVSKWDGDGRINTIYTVSFDGLSILYLGAQGTAELPKDVLEMDEPDVLIIPVGGKGTLTPAEAHKVSVNLEAKIVIPILYDEKTLKQFLKEAGSETIKPVERLTIKLKDVAGKENEVVVLGV